MPDDRFLHRRLGHSDKVTPLSDFEFRVWVQYILSSDDFGIMRFTAATLQADSDALASKGAKLVQRALERLAIVGLIRTFQHQSRTYCYQHDWQDFQRVNYPRATVHPKPPTDEMSEATRKLFTKYPGGWGRSGSSPPSGDGSPTVQGTVDERSANVQETFEECSSLALAVAVSPCLGLSRSREPVAVGGRAPAHPAARHGLAPLSRSHRGHAWCGERICVPEFLHERFVKAVGGDAADPDLRAFYADTLDQLPDSQPIESDPTKFWPPLVTARWPPVSSAVGSRTAALQRATAAFVRGGP